jgi:mono/diheme cytochrome c family protein
LSIIDVSDMKLRNTVLLDDPDRGAANPWDVQCSPDGKHLCVTHAGTHEISVIDRRALHKKLDEAKTAFRDSSLSYVSKDLTFMTGLRKRFPLSGDGPRGMAIVGSKVYTAEYFSDSLGMIDFNSPDTIHRPVALGPVAPQLSEARRGELLFNDARICFQGWQSCASCHPDGRADALNWDLLNDGIGNPKQTKSLLLSHQTPPSMVTGIRADAKIADRAGIKYILFTSQPEETATAIDAYLRSMPPVPSPYLQKGKLSKDAKHGEKIFKQAGCGECHTPPLYTNLKKYDIGLGTDQEKNREFDTPTLIETWRTAPYLYDGRAELMYEVFANFNKEEKHGAVSKVNKKYLFDLAEYVMSL